MPARAKRISISAAAFTAVATLLALALLFGGLGAGNGPAAANAGCNLRAKVKPYSRFPKPFASQYTKKLRVQVFNRTGNVKKWHLELYTYSGFYLGKSKDHKWMNWGDRAAIDLRQSMQPGPYTVVVKGKILGCGDAQTSDVVKLRGCLGKLPIQFFNKPKGQAADYNRGGWVSIGIRPRVGWSPIRNIHSTLRDNDGVRYGRASLPKGSRKLIGDQYLNHKLTRHLHPGKYTVRVTGKAPQPKACGTKTKTKTLHFH